jgi:CRP-like cAMP-binding protein
VCTVPHYTFEQEGNKMYVVVDGTLEVLVKDKKVRDIGRGDAVGELALLYR